MIIRILVLFNLCNLRVFPKVSIFAENRYSMKLLEFTKRFPDEESCEIYLKQEREKAGVICSHCGGTHHRWDKYNKCWICSKCGHHTTLRSGTVMHGSKLPLLYWFTAIHLLTSTKKTFSALEMQHQLGHKRYQPIWEMMHKLRSVMGLRDSMYKLNRVVELDEGFFTCDDKRNEGQKQETLKSGLGSERKASVLVMAESEPSIPKKKGQKDRKVGHLKMKVMKDLKADTINELAGEGLSAEAKIDSDAYPSHCKLTEVASEVNAKVVKPKEAPKALPWVHTAIANAKSLFRDMYHGIKEEFLQEYLNEFCYKFNRRYFGDKVFDRLVIAAVSYRPTFEHRMYENVSPKCG